MTEKQTEQQTGDVRPEDARPAGAGETEASKETPKEIGGRKGPEPTRYGDWEKGGICSDF